MQAGGCLAACNRIVSSEAAGRVACLKQKLLHALILDLRMNFSGSGFELRGTCSILRHSM